MESIAKRYFNDLGGTFPTISTSDEFYFFPHLPFNGGDAERSVETLDPDEIKDFTFRLKEYLGLLSRIDREGLEGEGEIDLALIGGSISGAIRELSDSPEDYPVWLRDPTFPLAILMESLSRSGGGIEKSNETDTIELMARLVRGGQTLIKNATRNLTGKKNRPDRSLPSMVAVDAARKMIADCIDFIGGPYLDRYLDRLSSSGGAGKKEGSIVREVERLLELLKGYGAALNGIGFDEGPSSGIGSPGVDYLRRVLEESYGENRTLDEIEETGMEEFKKGLERLEAMGGEISDRSGWGWRHTYESFFPPNFSPDDLIGTYSSEVERIRDHLDKSGVVDPRWAGELAIDEVPPYLRSVRSAAAYSAPHPTGKEGIKKPGIFYIIPSVPGDGEDNVEELKKSHREFIFMTAHETYPGHHLLDGVRTSLKNEIRSRIESPLFYEGWACYSEFLLLDSGYLRDSGHERGLFLQLARRDAWRWARLLIDIGFNRSAMKIDEAAAILESVGRPKVRAVMEALRIAVTPGYQLTYALGKYEFLRLRERYMEGMGPKDFHRTLLFGGEIPFEYVESRLKAEIDNAIN